MKTLLAVAGIALMTLATPAAAYDNPPSSDPHGDRTGSSGGGSTPVPAPPVVILFGLAAGAVMMRRKNA